MSSSDNKRIAKNTLLLYFRMFITMAVSLYTSRVVLNTLGVSDYGIYNVVGGIITIVSFLNVAMVQASQRYLAFELGRGSLSKLNRVFCTSLNIHAIICIIALLVGETIGLWFVNAKLVIPPERMIAANWVYQASIFTFIVNVMSVPYNASIVAHEKMSSFAYISILEVILKLLIVYMLLIFPFDKLIVYSILMVCVGLIIRLCYTLYCRRHFSECFYRYIFDIKLSKEMFSFAGWSVLGNLGFSFKDQLSNIIINLFFGTIVNAARGIGMHVTVIIQGFSANFTMALNPQITKRYASGDTEASRKLVYAGSRYTFYLLMLVSIPVIINVDYIMELWLGIVPKYTSQFVVYSLLTALLYSLSGCVTTALQATGNIKWFQIGICLIMLSELPFAWWLLKLGYPPYAAMWPSLVTYSIAVVFRFWLIHRYVPEYGILEYFGQVIARCLFIFLLSYFVCYWLFKDLQPDFLNLILSSCVSAFVVLSFVWMFGMLRDEKVLLIKKMKLMLKR